MKKRLVESAKRAAEPEWWAKAPREEKQRLKRQAKRRERRLEERRDRRDGMYD